MDDRSSEQIASNAKRRVLAQHPRLGTQILLLKPNLGPKCTKLYKSWRILSSGPCYRRVPESTVNRRKAAPVLSATNLRSVRNGRCAATLRVENRGRVRDGRGGGSVRVENRGRVRDGRGGGSVRVENRGRVRDGRGGGSVRVENHGRVRDVRRSCAGSVRVENHGRVRDVRRSCAAVKRESRPRCRRRRRGRGACSVCARDDVCGCAIRAERDVGLRSSN